MKMKIVTIKIKGGYAYVVLSFSQSLMTECDMVIKRNTARLNNIYIIISVTVHLTESIQ